MNRVSNANWNNVMRTIGFALLLSLFCGDALALSDREPIATIRNTIVAQLLDGDHAGIQQEITEDTAFIREIAPKRLGVDVVSSATEVAGVNFRFAAHAQNPQGATHVTVWVFSYPDTMTALRVEKSVQGLCRNGCHFRATKLLTPFSCAVVGSQVILTFTEKARDERTVAFVHSVPTLFDKE